MPDVVLLLVVIGFFAAASAHLKACAAIVAPPGADGSTRDRKTPVPARTDPRAGTA